MTKFEKLNIYALSVSMSTSPLVAMGTGPTAVAPIRLMASVLLVLTVFSWILVFTNTYRKLWSFGSYSVLNLLWLGLAIYLPVRDVLSPHFQIEQIFTALNFSLLPLSSILLSRTLILKSALNERRIMQFILPSIISLLISIFYASDSFFYLVFSWVSLSFLFVPPVYFLLCFGPSAKKGNVFNIASFALILSTLLSLWFVGSFAVSFQSRTLIVSCIYSLAILSIAVFFNGTVSKGVALVLSPLLIFSFASYISSSDFILSFQAKNNAVLSSASSVDYGFASSVLSFFGFGDNRAFVWFDLFSRDSITLLFGDPGATLFSVMHGGTERGGVEGFFANMIMDYGLVSTSLLCFFLALVLIKAFSFIFRIYFARHRVKSIQLINVVFNGYFPCLVLFPLIIQGLSFYNPSSSLAYVYMFTSVSFFLSRRSFSPPNC